MDNFTSGSVCREGAKKSVGISICNARWLLFIIISASSLLASWLSISSWWQTCSQQELHLLKGGKKVPGYCIYSASECGISIHVKWTNLLHLLILEQLFSQLWYLHTVLCSTVQVAEIASPLRETFCFFYIISCQFDFMITIFKICIASYIVAHLHQ